MSVKVIDSELPEAIAAGTEVALAGTRVAGYNPGVSESDQSNRANVLRRLLATAEISLAVNEAWTRNRGAAGSPAAVSPAAGAPMARTPAAGTKPRTELKFIHALFCDQYQTNAVFFIEPSADGKSRNLVAYYENDRPAFRAGIPDDWSEDEVIRFLSSNTPGGPYPVWEIAARTAGSQMLGPASGGIQS